MKSKDCEGKPRDEYDIIVVGGGIAGLTATAYACFHGKKTLLCEKEEKIGGLVNTFWYRGFAFDGGIRALENSGILFPMLKSLGIDICFKKSPVAIGMQGKWVNLESQGLEGYTSLLENCFPHQHEDIHGIMQEINRMMQCEQIISGIENPLFLDPKTVDGRYLMKTLLPWLIKYQKSIKVIRQNQEPIDAFLQRITQNASLADLISQHFFKGTPAYFALSYFSLYQDYYYPMGGIEALPQGLMDFILKKEGKIRTNCSVTGINEIGHGIALKNGEQLGYQKLIWAADQTRLYHCITHQGHRRTHQHYQSVAKGQYGDSVLSFFLGVDLEADYFNERCGSHGFYTESLLGLSSLEKWQERFSKGPEALYEWVRTYLERTTYEIAVPSLMDARLSPRGQTGITLSTLIDYELIECFERWGEYRHFKAFCTKTVIELLSQGIFPGLKEKILFHCCGTPQTIERKTGNRGGALTGWAFMDHGLPAENRMQKITKAVETPFEDILQCGQWTFSPSGLPVSILTGKIAADRCCKR